jgi:hypothetical protein
MKELDVNARALLEVTKAVGRVDIMPGYKLFTGKHLSRIYHTDEFQLDTDYFLEAEENGKKYLYPLYGEGNVFEAVNKIEKATGR